ncbi:MAG: phosphatidate cytidylyltransferase [Lacipirellulaceae bacterium]
MLFWRITLGFLFVAVLVGLAWLDFGAARPGVIMAPLAIAGTVLAAGELVRMFEHDPLIPAPSRYVVVPGALVTVLASCVPMLWRIDQAPGPVAATIGNVGWVALGLAAACSVSFSIEMLRYRAPGSATARLALAVLGIAYAGGLMGFVVQLRLLAGGPWGADARWGMVALLSMITAVKTHDIGAFVVGGLLGRTKFAPVLSPKKTIEGLVGGFATSIAATALLLGPIAHLMGCHAGRTPAGWWLGCVVFALLVGGAGVAGDLAVSLLKRDARLKDSSTWMPGFGGVLDLLDSVLFAAPVAYILWIARCVGP